MQKSKYLAINSVVQHTKIVDNILLSLYTLSLVLFTSSANDYGIISSWQVKLRIPVITSPNEVIVM